MEKKQESDCTLFFGKGALSERAALTIFQTQGEAMNTFIYKLFPRFLLVVLLTGCAPWPNKRMQEVSGIPVSKEVSLCKTISTKSAMKGCEPSVGGQRWQKAKVVKSLPLDSGLNYEAKAERIVASYLGHKYSRGDVLVSCPKVDPFGKKEYSDYFALEKTKSSLASIFSETAVNQAKVELRAVASANKQTISAEGMANFEAAMMRALSTESSQSADVIYVQGYMTTGLDEVPDLFAPYAKCLEGLDMKNESIVTGIAGFYLSDFHSKTHIFREDTMATALDLAANASPSDRKVLEDAKLEASGKWAADINRKLEQTMVGKDFGETFYPLYIRFGRP